MSTNDDLKELGIDPAALAGLSTEEREQAIATARAARRAEERAEQRALERALERKRQERERERQQEEDASKSKLATTAQSNTASGAPRLTFVPKRKRAAGAEAETEKEDEKAEKKDEQKSKSNGNHPQKAQFTATTARRPRDWTEQEFSAVQETYLGKSAKQETPTKKQRKGPKKATFKFRWEDTDDTFAKSDDPLYSLSKSAVVAAKRAAKPKIDPVISVQSVHEKPISKMTARDWRILRENYQITIQGGQAPPPMRTFREPPAEYLPTLHPALLEAIEQVLRFKEPSPIQRQAIPIGLQRRDLIGIAETGSGKTVAFGVPLCHYLLNLPSDVLGRVAAQGPLALVMAPTRELALQIHLELEKLLSRQNVVHVCAIVGGQSIQQQAQVLRRGVHIVVGTPGRINDCLDMAYLVLNQCCYIVLDEADRMIDMGFAPQMESILDAMGGSIKSESAEETYQQEKEDLEQGGLARHRLTAMFSATMPAEVERLAKQYLRHPAVISIGDPDSRKNARITQKILFLSSPAQKEKALRDLLLDPRFRHEKVIVFCNEKRHADQVGRMVDRIMGRPCVVLHGGKTQEQREENLAKFRRGGIVMVATDVAGRGLDIPDVAHVINYDLPTRSIENYTHRIGRTGRAGKTGLATSLLTEEDQGIMAALKQYLESTGNAVPDRLARHSAASGTEHNNLIY